MNKKRVNDEKLEELAHALGMEQSDKAYNILDSIGGVRSVVYDLQDAREEIASLKKKLNNKHEKDYVVWYIVCFKGKSWFYDEPVGNLSKARVNMKLRKSQGYETKIIVRKTIEVDLDKDLDICSTEKRKRS